MRLTWRHVMYDARRRHNRRYTGCAMNALSDRQNSLDDCCQDEFTMRNGRPATSSSIGSIDDFVETFLKSFWYTIDVRVS